MSRIRKVYEGRFRLLLSALNARRLERGVQWRLDHAWQSSQRDGISLTHAFERSYCHLRETVITFSQRREQPGHGTRKSRPGIGTTVKTDRSLPPRFLCDAGLGGLARWLRAAGYEAIWIPDIDDPELLRQAQQLRATVLTTDSLMMERGVLRDGIIPALWLPPTLMIAEQLGLVFREFRLVIRDPRCMRCAGELRRVDKESVRERIPPRTAAWLDEYFLCARCGQLFWRGTHWRKITGQLQRLVAPGVSDGGDQVDWRAA